MRGWYDYTGGKESFKNSTETEERPKFTSQSLRFLSKHFWLRLAHSETINHRLMHRLYREKTPSQQGGANNNNESTQSPVLC